jgi:hypothetical protein
LKFVDTYTNASGETVNGSYVELKKLKAEVPIEESQSVSGYDEEGQETTTELTVESTGEGDAKSYVQTVAFMMRINTCGEPNTLQNQVFTDYDNMSFTFMFKRGDDEFYVDCGSVTMIETTGCNGDTGATKSIDLVFSMKCPQEMGTLCDEDGNARAWTCNMIAKTSSGFSYRLDFKLNVQTQSLPEDSETPSITFGSIY